MSPQSMNTGDINDVSMHIVIRGLITITFMPYEIPSLKGANDNPTHSHLHSKHTPTLSLSAYVDLSVCLLLTVSRSISVPPSVSWFCPWLTQPLTTQFSHIHAWMDGWMHSFIHSFIHDELFHSEGYLALGNSNDITTPGNSDRLNHHLYRL